TGFAGGFGCLSGTHEATNISPVRNNTPISLFLVLEKISDGVGRQMQIANRFISRPVFNLH
ncbi:MAG: hypothetical protein OEY00_14005, partial [Gammaproteobacteria bacterium]|nr:hypothetical protein [Gammaproteobacteria bacterium]